MVSHAMFAKVAYAKQAYNIPRRLGLSQFVF